MRIETQIGEPILFRTTTAEVYASTLMTGELWLRSDAFYRNIEDRARNDGLEGVNTGRSTIPMAVEMTGGDFVLQGNGNTGAFISPHYIFSMHGHSISEAQRADFGGHTFGIRAYSQLAAEIYYRASRRVSCTGSAWGAVSYRYTSLTLSRHTGGAPIVVNSRGVDMALRPLNLDALVKHPTLPFIEQDEWRVVVFTDGYIDGDANLPLRLRVDPAHFYANSDLPPLPLG